MGISNVGDPGSVGEGELISICGTYPGSFPRGDVYNAISSSGRVVFFTSAAAGVCGGFGPPVNEVFARFEGAGGVPAHTVAVSEPPLSGVGSVPGRACTGVCATAAEHPAEYGGNAVFGGASLDGSRVFFMTGQPLVNGDRDGGVDLYEADLSGGAVTRLVQVSRGGAGDSTPGLGAGVLGVVRVSEDGSHVYFVAEGRLTGANREGKAPVEGEPNLYVASSVCPGGGAGVWGSGGRNAVRRDAVQER